MKKIIFIFVLFFPVFAFADTYANESGISQMIANAFMDLQGFFFDDVPSLIQRFYAWALTWYIKAQLFAKYEMIKFSWGVAKQILINLNIMSQITNAISSLPHDVKTALVEMRVFDAINVVINAHITRYVMRVVNF